MDYENSNYLKCIVDNLVRLFDKIVSAMNIISTCVTNDISTNTRSIVSVDSDDKTKMKNEFCTCFY